MAYEKFITKNGKTYGPYVYHSKRVGGKVVSEYRGTNKKSSDKKFLVFGALLVIVLLSIFVFLFSFQFTGRSIINFENEVKNGIITGNINLVLKPGELIPENSTLIIENGENTYNFTLNQILKTPQAEGNYYMENKNIMGNGKGYGFIGKKETTPTIFFQIKVSNKETSPEETTEPMIEINETVPSENISSNETVEPTIEENVSTSSEETTSEITEEIPSETISEEPTQEIQENEITLEIPVEEIPSETPATTETTSEEITPAPITGNAISKLFFGVSNFFRGFITGNVIEENLIQGDIKKGETFTYEINENSKIEIAEGSVKTETTNLDESVLIINQNENTLEITTNYSIVEEGFGKEYLNDEEKYIAINSKDLGINLVEGKITIKIIYLDSELMNLESLVSTEITEEETNETIEKTIEELFNETQENETITNKTIFSTEIINLTNEEKAILKFMFNEEQIEVKTNNYRDKVIVEFNIGKYSLTEAYENDLSNEDLEKLIERDKIIWLKDLIREYNKKEINLIERNDLNISTSF